MNRNLYTLVTVLKRKKTIDNVTTSVGFRTIRFEADKGFFLNGRNLKLKGICMHHDAGTLGAAVPREETARRLDILKELGCNAIRTSHNPFSPDFLELCDMKGFLVIGEAFDEWELPKKKWLEDGMSAHLGSRVMQRISENGQKPTLKILYSGTVTILQL